MLEVKNISKSFGTTKAVSNLSFSIEKGEVVGLLGPNGAGKTTTMRVLANFYEPDEGEVLIDGVTIQANPLRAKKHIGYLPENNPLYPDVPVDEYLRFVGLAHGISRDKIDKALEKAIELTSLESVVFKPIAELSKGYRQRTGLAAAILHEPDVLILDEPTEGLDPNQRLEIRELLHRLGKQHTVLLSTHVLSEVQHTCDRLLIINEGHLAAQGSVTELLSGDANRQRVLLEVEGQNVRRGIETLDSVRIVAYTTAHGRKRLTVESSHKEDLRPVLFRLSKDHNWTLWELNRERRGLEDIFTQFTKSKSNL